MRHKSASAEELEQVYELNSLFLHFLRFRVENGGSTLGLPAKAAASLRQIPLASIDRFAEFPKAFFRVELAAVSTGEALIARDGADALMMQSLKLTVLSNIRNTCRQSPYLARAFFDLSSRAIQQLRTTPVSGLPDLAQTTEFVCAFENRPWLWDALLTATDAESRRRLFLVVLQPAGRDIEIRQGLFDRAGIDSR